MWGICYNQIFYADDLCQLAPCAIALQKLLAICHEYRVEHDVIYNPGGGGGTKVRNGWGEEYTVYN